MSRFLLIATLALLLVACEGGLTADEAATPPAVPEESFVQQAEEVCAGSRLELDPARREVFEGEAIEPADAQQTFERAAALLQTELEDLRGLEPPADLEDPVVTWLDEVEAAALAYEEAGASADAAESLIARGDPLVEAERTADDLGMRLCGLAEHRRQDPTVEEEPTP